MARQVNSIRQLEYFDIKLMFCGLDTFVPNVSNNPAIKQYALHFISEGKGTFSIFGKNYKIERGDILFVPPNVPYFTQTTPENRLQLYYLSFTGPNCMTFMKHAGLTLDNAVVHSDIEYVHKKFHNIFKLMETNSFTSIMKANAEFIDVLCSLFEKIPENNVLRNKNNSTYALMVEEYIQKYYNEDLKISDICKYVHVSRTYLSTLFKKIKGISIKDYIIAYRIDRACDLLLTTDLSVTEIALRTGFNNSVSFYRQFRQLMIASPRYYRMKNRKYNIEKNPNNSDK